MRAGGRRERGLFRDADVAGAVAAGGALGGLARWAVGDAVPAHPETFPWATFAVNVTGCLLLGVTVAILLEAAPPSRYARPFLGVGVLGGFTTFSTYTTEVLALLRNGHAMVAVCYLLATLLSCLVVSWIGLTLVRAGVRRGTRERRS